MTTQFFLMHAWQWKPAAALGCCALAAAYAVAVKFRFTMRSLVFVAGVVLLAITLFSPLDYLASCCLLSAHMAKHVALVLVVPALLLIGIPAMPARKLPGMPAVRGRDALSRQPWLAWAAGISAMALWHVPPLFHAAMESRSVNIAEQVSLLAAGTIFWWPVLSPLAESRVAPVPSGAAYLFTACLACSAIGILLTFSPPGAYGVPLQSADPAVLALVRNEWGISAREDQQIAGLLMWVPGCLIYLTAIMAMFARWYSEPEAFGTGTTVEPARI